MIIYFISYFISISSCKLFVAREVAERFTPSRVTFESRLTGQTIFSAKLRSRARVGYARLGSLLHRRHNPATVLKALECVDCNRSVFGLN